MNEYNRNLLKLCELEKNLIENKGRNKSCDEQRTAEEKADGIAQCVAMALRVQLNWNN